MSTLADRSEPPGRDRSTDRPGTSARNGRAGRSSGSARNGPGRKRTGKPGRSNAQLAAAVRELAEANGGPPSQYQVKQALGVGSQRAARLLAELDRTASAATSGPNRSAGKEGDQ